MKVDINFFPGWKRKAVTFSYDDGALSDCRLEEIFSKYGLKCTYNISSSFIGRDPAYVGFDWLKELHKKGQEIACHGRCHQWMTHWSESMILSEYSADKEVLERETESMVFGGAYPFGAYTCGAKKAVAMLGLDYMRTTKSTFRFGIPEDFTEWNPTCHHRDAEALADKFLTEGTDLRLFFIWGHSFEFDREKNWSLMENLANKISSAEDVWYETNIGICRYLQAVRKLRQSAGGRFFYNDSAVDIFMEADGRRVIFHPGFNVIR